MAGVKGMKGGGGKRAGAGRKPRAAEPAAPAGGVSAIGNSDDSKVFLLALMNDTGADLKLRADAAKTLLPFQHAKPGEAGKKDERAAAAKVAGAGKFGAGAPPKLVVSNK